MTGQVVEYETYDSILLHQPLPADIVDFWTRTIVWYQIVGGEVLRKKLADRREQMQNRKSHLLRLAPTEPVRKQVVELERSYALLESEIAFAEAGFLARTGEFYNHETRLDPLAEVASVVRGEIRELSLSVRPSKVGMGPGVVLSVSCLVPPLTREYKQVDKFEAYVPCRYHEHEMHFAAEPVSKCYGWPGRDYDDLSIADVAESLQKVFLHRNPHLKTTGTPPVLRYGSRALAGEEKAADLFLQSRGGTIAGGLYSESVMLVLGLAPPPPPERVPSKEAGLARSDDGAGQGSSSEIAHRARDIIDELAATISDSIIAEVSQEEVGVDDY